ncbi:MAG: cytochrome c biogenesis protein CcsA [Cyclobacteriaceae bacterium]|nr:cytochrome c biogenesis protein CcsA [Cyclobacteriaceae bacterium]
MKFFKFLFSGTFMGILLIVFAVSLGYATFVENDYGSATAKLLIYNARWFEILMLLMIINFSGMIFSRQLYRKSKINILLMHLSFIVIIVGAGITRYFGFEGSMHIRENETTNEFITDETFIHYQMRHEKNEKNVLDKILLAPVNKNLYAESTSFQARDVTVEIQRFIPNAVEMVHPDESGDPYLTLITAAQGQRMNFYLKESETVPVGHLNISFGESSGDATIEIIRDGQEFFVRAPFEIIHTNMGSGQMTRMAPDTLHAVQLMNIYTARGINFVLREFFEKAKLEYVPAEEGSAGAGNIVEVKVTVDRESEVVKLSGGRGIVGNLAVFDVNGIDFSMTVGSQVRELPFALKLNDFELERYPGSESPSSFASEITLIDEENDVNRPYRIFMNNILQYQGYRFYQSSYDQDERGTILSVNHDRMGTIVTYTGYFLLFFTLLVSLVTPKTRFAKLREQLDEIHMERKKLAAICLVLLFSLVNLTPSGAQSAQTGEHVIPGEHAAQFGKLLLQARDGRIIPVNTTAENVLVKMYKKNRFNNLSADQVFLSMMVFPQEWKDVPLLKVYDKTLQKQLGIDGEFVSYNGLFDSRGQYKLKEQVDEAYARPPGQRTKLDKELVNLDERLNVAYMVFNRLFLKIYPVPDHPNDLWVKPADEIRHIAEEDSLFIRNSFLEYTGQLRSGVGTHDYSAADRILEAINDFQNEYGREIIPPTLQTNLEVLYNKLSIFKRLFPLYMTAGMILLAISLIQLFKPSFEFRIIVKIFLVLLVIGFIAHTFGLALRWYISGHAPWSNGYESMIYIAWATMLAGFIFYKKSAMTLSVTSILAGITLLTAHMSWMNPEITNLVPVLKSYWLTLHVATITASYGFLGLGSMLGFLNLSIMIFRNSKNQNRVNLTLQELTYIIEISLMIGLILLVIGNFLGGIWANESWGRYWGWDPKETWSLVTIIVYTFILHMRLIPGMKSLFSTNFGALIGFGSVLMTYFGVNYYLSGLHSYAQGDPVPIPGFVYYLLFFILLVSVLAAINDAKMKSPAPSA